jgi:hypothetical protein
MVGSLQSGCRRWPSHDAKFGWLCKNVLKINITDSPEEQRWSLQGRLVDQWAIELGSIWRKLHNRGDKRRCVVELTDVTLIGRTGEAVLAEMMTEGAEFIASDVYAKYVLRTLRNEVRRSATKHQHEHSELP